MDLVLGRPLSSAEDKDERVGSFAGVSVFSLDALSSAAYGSEAALTIVIPLGGADLRFSLPITIAVSSILAIVYFSYRQTIAAYPNEAGFLYRCERKFGSPRRFAESRCAFDRLHAECRSWNIGGEFSAIPFLQPYTMVLCLAILGLLYESQGNSRIAVLFYAPTYLFVDCLAAGGHPHPSTPPAEKKQIT
jgi:hypothetical protein